MVRRPAEYFRKERNLRVVTWDDLAVGGRGFQADFSIWVENGAIDYYHTGSIYSKFTSSPALTMVMWTFRTPAADIVAVTSAYSTKPWPRSTTTSRPPSTRSFSSARALGE